MSSEGWFVLSRAMVDPTHDLHPRTTGESACRAWAWTDLIGSAKWKESGGVGRGQLRAAESFLARRWNWNRSRVSRFLSDLEKDGRIERIEDGGPRDPNIISICNYEDYQDVRTASDPRTANGTANGLRAGQHKPSHGTELQESPNNERGTNGTANGTQEEPEQERRTTTVSDLWSIWIEELGGDPPYARLTRKRREKLDALYSECLADADEPSTLFRRILRTVKASDHHMSRRTYQFPESLFRNEERRDRWADMARNGNGARRSTRRSLQHVK